MVGIPELAGKLQTGLLATLADYRSHNTHKNIFSVHPRCFDTVTNFLLIVVAGRRIDVTVARLEGNLYGMLYLVGPRLLCHSVVSQL